MTTKKFETAPEDRISVPNRVIYGAGAFVNNLLAGSIGGMMIVLNLGLGMNPALVGLLGALPRLTDAITDPLMGYISDNTKSRWGRRRPYILVGAIAVGIIYAVLWQLPLGMSENFYFWYFLVGSLIFYLAYTIFATPWVAMGYELTPDYHERTRLMGTQNFIGQLAYFVPPWLLLIMQDDRFFTDIVDGAAGVAIAIGVFSIAVGILPAIFLKERFSQQIPTGEAAPPPDDDAPTSAGQAIGAVLKDFFVGFGKALKFIPFLKLCLATFLVFNGFILISSFQAYVIIYFVSGGDQEMGGLYVGLAGTVQTFSTFVVIGLVTWMSTRLGKRRTFIISTLVSMIGYLMKWFCYNPDIPILVVLPAPLIAFGLGGLFTIMPSMIADVVDADELNTNERREGMYGSIFWWVVKLGMAAAIAGGGYLLNATGFDVALGGDQTERAIFLMRLFDAVIPAAASLIAMWAVYTFTITEERAHEIRIELEKRRGGGSTAEAPAPA
ncbi:MAG: MFS transporter [Woeseiaceae bacterium]|nr:MFS transporter [Woeseiaceae bacterium]